MNETLNFKTKLDDIKDETSTLLKKINSKFDTNTFLNFDSLNLNTQDTNTKNKTIKLMASENYTNLNEEKIIQNRQKNHEKIYAKKNTRHQIVQYTEKKILSYKHKQEEALNDISIIYKLIALFNKYKALKIEIKAYFEYQFSEIITLENLSVFDTYYSILKKNHPKYNNYLEFNEFLENLKNEEEEIINLRNKELSK